MIREGCRTVIREKQKGDPGRAAEASRLTCKAERSPTAEVPAPEAVAALLGTPTVVVRRRIIQLDGIPCELTDTYYPASIAGGTRLAEKGKIPGGAVTLLAELGHVGARVREDVTARMPSTEERDILRLAPDEPVLTLTRVTLDGGDRPIQADMMVMPAHRQRLRYELQIG
ncbi:UTRA domain-containing protein [Streptomyces murinus]|uniref:UTRA domain-containing protein n=1 Tax=Streptomyces murinus TaxID=33900 RepID=UPI00362BE0BA